MRIAFFDLDRTVLAVNSATLWLRRELRLGHITRKSALRGAFWVGLYQLGFAAIEDALGQAVRTLAGVEESTLKERTLAFWREEVRAHIRPGARRTLEEHRARGDRLYLLTSSSSYLSEAACQELGFHGSLANRFEVDAGVFTGRALAPLCYGPGKVAHAEELAAALGASLAESTFYTDSYSDLPMLEAVGTPVVVHPDPRLSRHARRLGWRVERWHR